MRRDWRAAVVVSGEEGGTLHDDDFIFVFLLESIDNYTIIGLS